MDSKTLHVENTKQQFSAINAIQKKEKSKSAITLQDNRPKSVLQKNKSEGSINEVAANTIQKKANNTGLPNNLKSGIENLSGHSMDDVKVHYNSGKPAQLNAHAYAQGSDIHIASGQEKHLPHEAWHVVQQKQGRVKPTLQMKSKVNENTSSETVQRMMITVEPDAAKKLGDNKKAIDTLHKLVSIMQHALHLDFPEDIINIEITNTGELTPAWNHHKGTKFRPGKPGNIGVELNKWYLEKVSIGDLIAMFIHEIGVHTFADKQMGLEISPEGKSSADPESHAAIEYADQSNDHYQEKIKGKIAKFPNDIESGKKKGRSRQRDHVNLAKSLVGGNSTRSQIYTALYLKSGDAVEATVDEKEKDKVLKDLTFSFLFDLGRLVATDDGGPVSIFKNTGAIGELMKFFGERIVDVNKGKHKWLKKAAANINTKAWPIRGFLLRQLGTMAVSSNPIVKKGRRSLAGGIVGGGIALVAGATALPAIAAGLGVAFGLHYFQNRFGVS